jgi:hypothetical protein
LNARAAHLAGMSLADTYRDNAADCAFLAERAEDDDTKHTLMGMEAAWRMLANQQEILDCMRWKPLAQVGRLFLSAVPYGLRTS